MYTFNWMFLAFGCYAVLGYVVEVVYCSSAESLKARAPVLILKRGAVSGPFAVLYGCGSLGVILLVDLLRTLTTLPLVLEMPIVFFGGGILTTLLEITVGWFGRKLFGGCGWDYRKSDKKHAFAAGLACYEHMIAFACGCVIVIYWVQPQVIAPMLAALSPTETEILTILLALSLGAGTMHAWIFRKQKMKK